MILDFEKTKQGQLARGAGLALCLLVLVFSFAAKLSWYQPKDVAVHGLTSGKMWQQCELKTIATIMSAPEDSGSSTMHAAMWASTVLLLVAVTRLKLSSLAPGEWLSDRETRFSLRQTEFARVSQLRAPPVR